ncbi:MAG: hypothetical protein ACOCT9_03200 [archaeon]
MKQKIINEIDQEADNIYYGEIKLIIKKGKIKFIESKKSKKID